MVENSLATIASEAIKPFSKLIDAMLGPKILRIKNWAEDQDLNDRLGSIQVNILLDQYMKRLLRRICGITTIVFPQQILPLTSIYEPLSLHAEYLKDHRKRRAFSIKTLETGNNYLIVDSAGMGKSNRGAFPNLLYNHSMLRKSSSLLLFVSFLLASCAPGKIFGPTFTPLPTITQTFTPTFTSTPSVTPTPTITHTPTITPTPTVDYNQIFFDPQSEADFSRVIEAPSPIDDPADFAVWQNGYLTAVDERLVNYPGPSIDATVTSIDFQGAQLDIATIVWPVIATYKFKWQGQEMLTKTFVASDGKGNLVTFSATYSTPGSRTFDSRVGYKSPPKGLFVGVFFEWNDFIRSLVTDEFASSFLPKGKEDIVFDPWRRFCIGSDTEADRAVISRARFMMGRFGNG